ncbi:hypothetical protein Rxycam_02299 [Rubrobacter xylanophilus DSM 9941]|uniref:tripartite tricarboxylate transporter TctB family protein n=1 Tax=Rubrobacter xylanophilus TaxID=49319 RepID=UPI001C63B8D6|nr:tripartite tricarboxylate transporter TctB family protein [Rubrobacter xylanophilus]QYJ16466.1 hypothetical protein Rxycam_02299 [Rubrobacter xylanophilus DSM 9941]
MRGLREAAPDLVGGVLLAGLGAALAAGATGYQVVTGEGRLGPGFMPFVVGLLLAVFGGMVCVQALWGGRGSGEAGESAGGRSVAVVFALTLLAILLAPVIGFLPAFGLLIFALVRFVEGEGWVVAAVLGAGAAAAAWAVFVLFLQIPLPGGAFVAGG